MEEIMKDDDFKCPQCGTAAKNGQNFCGDCGQKLITLCSACHTANPPTYKYCGQCGQDLRPVGTLLLDRTGLIIDADQTAGEILQIHNDALLGKPFSIFVKISNRAFFFSHWNMVLRSTKTLDLEVELAPEPERLLHTHLAIESLAETGEMIDQIRVEIDDISDRRHNTQQLEERDKLLEFIGSLADIFHPPGGDIRQNTIGGILEKIGIISYAQYAFIARIDRENDSVKTEFTWQAKDAPQRDESIASLPLDTIRPILDKLQKGKTCVTEDFTSLTLSEQQSWQRWHQSLSSPGSILCELMYRDKQPVGIIGLIKTESGIWQRNIMILIKLAAQLLSETLARSLSGKSVLHRSADLLTDELEKDSLVKSQQMKEFDEGEIIIDEHEEIEMIEEQDERMLVQPSAENITDGVLPVFATDDGVYVLKCPECERRETISTGQFEADGWILKVTCPCSCSFRIIREFRKTHRKDVRLSGLFSRSGDDYNKLGVSGNWGAMEVTNISKSGLNFKTPQARLLEIGQDVQLQFNLDNSTKSLIEKSATIKSVRKNNVGCQFQSAGKHDVTLGFYFL